MRGRRPTATRTVAPTPESEDAPRASSRRPRLASAMIPAHRAPGETVTLAQKEQSRPTGLQSSHNTRIERGTVWPNQSRSRTMNPRRSSLRIIWLTEGAETRKCRSMSASAGATPKRTMYFLMKSRYSCCRPVGRGRRSGRRRSLPEGDNSREMPSLSRPKTTTAPPSKWTAIECGDGWVSSATTSPAIRFDNPRRSSRGVT